MVVGAPAWFTSSMSQLTAGVVWTRGMSSGWTQRLYAPPNAGNSGAFGASLAMSGGRLAVGDPSANNRFGEVFLFTLPPGANPTWSFEDSVKTFAVNLFDRFG